MGGTNILLLKRHKYLDFTIRSKCCKYLWNRSFCKKKINVHRGEGTHYTLFVPEHGPYLFPLYRQEEDNMICFLCTGTKKTTCTRDHWIPFYSLSREARATACPPQFQPPEHQFSSWLALPIRHHQHILLPLLAPHAHSLAREPLAALQPLLGEIGHT